MSLTDHEMSWWYRKPPEKFWEGLPIGCGRFAGMVHGTPGKELITFNDETLWSGGPYNPIKPGGPDMFARIRKDVSERHFRKADEDALHMIGCPSPVQQYQAMGTLQVVFDGHEDFLHYNRRLDMQDAVVRTSYESNGTRYGRECFASYPDQAIVVLFTADRPASLFLECHLVSLQPVENLVVQTHGTSGTIRMDGRIEDAVKTGERFYERVIPSVVRWQAVLKVEIHGGVMESVNPHEQEDSRCFLRIRGADSVELYLVGATNVKSWNNVSADPEERCRKWLQGRSDAYGTILTRHLQDYRPLFCRCSLHLGGAGASAQSTSDRLTRMRQGENDPHFLAQYFQYARYLLLAAAREGTLAYNNHNIWLDNLDGRWQGRWTLNINLQECYWPVDSTGLPELYDSLVRFCRQLAESGRRTASELYGLPGWCSHHGTDIWMNTAPQDHATWHSIYPLSGAWLCHALFDHYLFTRDKDYLQDIYDLMKGAAEFCLGLLMEDKETGYLVTCPSTSPENHFLCPEDRIQTGVSAGSAGDTQILRALFRDCLRAQAILQVDSAFGHHLSEALERLPQHRIGRFGQLQEWLEDFDETPGEITHRHVSHLFALYPDDDITPTKTPSLAYAIRECLKRRGEQNLGWAAAWRINLLARLGDSEWAYRYLIRAASDISLHPEPTDSLITPSFEGNQGIQGIAAGIIEMIMQSHEEEIKLLPALPAAWREGEVKGLRARGGYIVDIRWKDSGLQSAKILPSMNGCCRIWTSRIVPSLAAHAIQNKAESSGYRYEVPCLSGFEIHVE